MDWKQLIPAAALYQGIPPNNLNMNRTVVGGEAATSVLIPQSNSPVDANLSEILQRADPTLTNLILLASSLLQSAQNQQAANNASLATQVQRQAMASALAPFLNPGLGQQISPTPLIQNVSPFFSSSQAQQQALLIQALIAQGNNSQSAPPFSLSAHQKLQQLENQLMASASLMNQNHLLARQSNSGASPKEESSPAVDSTQPRQAKRQKKDDLPVGLALPEDYDILSGHQIFLRHQIEVFSASGEDVFIHKRGRNKPVSIGQIGIRCRHCAQLPVRKRQKGCTYFPATVVGIYQAAQNMCKTHMQSGLCSDMPSEMKGQLTHLLSIRVSAGSGAGRKYWTSAALKLGLVDTDDGIRYRPTDTSKESVQAADE